MWRCFKWPNSFKIDHNCYFIYTMIVPHTVATNQTPATWSSLFFSRYFKTPAINNTGPIINLLSLNIIFQGKNIVLFLIQYYRYQTILKFKLLLIMAWLHKNIVHITRLKCTLMSFNRLDRYELSLHCKCNMRFIFSLCKGYPRMHCNNFRWE